MSATTRVRSSRHSNQTSLRDLWGVVLAGVAKVKPLPVTSFSALRGLAAEQNPLPCAWRTWRKDTTYMSTLLETFSASKRRRIPKISIDPEYGNQYVRTSGRRYYYATDEGGLVEKCRGVRLWRVRVPSNCNSSFSGMKNATFASLAAAQKFARALQSPSAPAAPPTAPAARPSRRSSKRSKPDTVLHTTDEVERALLEVQEEDDFEELLGDVEIELPPPLPLPSLPQLSPLPLSTPSTPSTPPPKPPPWSALLCDEKLDRADVDASRSTPRAKRSSPTKRAALTLQIGGDSPFTRPLLSFSFAPAPLAPPGTRLPPRLYNPSSTGGTTGAFAVLKPTAVPIARLF